MLTSEKYRRTDKCGHYERLLAEKNKTIKTFPIEIVQGSSISNLSILRGGLERPIVVHDIPGLKLPVPTTTLTNIAEIVNVDFPIKIIEVGAQEQVEGCTIGQFAHYLHGYKKGHHKVLNLISLEFSATPLSTHVQSPALVRDIDWIDVIWPIKRRARGDFPCVQKYCLSGMAGSYTDFHVDFGGTSVWYHVVWGKKRFYLIEPTCANLKIYEKWVMSADQETHFLGDLVAPGECYLYDLEPGMTFMIPGGWIHSVYTPDDSLVFGGNFLHSTAILRQLQVYEIEHKTHVNKAFRFPYFREINWYLVCRLLPPAAEKYGLANLLDVREENSDSDDDEDLAALCDAIESPIVFRQFPYLIRICDFWLSHPRRQQESEVHFGKIAKMYNFKCPETVIALWWKVLYKIAHKLDAAAGPEEVVERAFLNRVKRMPAFSTLDEMSVAGTVCSNLDIRDLMTKTGEIRDYAEDLPGSPGGASSGSKGKDSLQQQQQQLQQQQQQREKERNEQLAAEAKLKAEAEVKARAEEQARLAAAAAAAAEAEALRKDEERKARAERKEQLRLEYERKLAELEKEEEEKEKEKERVRLEELERKEKEEQADAPPAGLKIKMSKAPAEPSAADSTVPEAPEKKVVLRLMKRTENAPSPSTIDAGQQELAAEIDAWDDDDDNDDNDEEQQPEDEQQPNLKLSIKLKRKQEPVEAPVPRRTRAPPKKRSRLIDDDCSAPRAPRVRAKKEVVQESAFETLEEVEGDHGGGVYGTRGKKLSAAFLQHTSNIDGQASSSARQREYFEDEVDEDDEYDEIMDEEQDDDDDFVAETANPDDLDVSDDDEDDYEDDVVEEEQEDFVEKRKTGKRKAAPAPPRDRKSSSSAMRVVPASVSAAPAQKKPVNHKSNVLKVLRIRR